MPASLLFETGRIQKRTAPASRRETPDLRDRRGNGCVGERVGRGGPSVPRLQGGQESPSRRARYVTQFEVRPPQHQHSRPGCKPRLKGHSPCIDRRRAIRATSPKLSAVDGAIWPFVPGARGVIAGGEFFGTIAMKGRVRSGKLNGYLSLKAVDGCLRLSKTVS